MLKEVEAFVWITRLSKDIFKEVEAFLNYYKDFIKITSVFEDIPR
jgi:hypothetical protein